ncbi:hypothetical protein Leryth_026214 [Lithospermum erythrorhizon]|nr:hypothetical protein Leryth_026214 [Lithospermum erythrorhizon]
MNIKQMNIRLVCRVYLTPYTTAVQTVLFVSFQALKFLSAIRQTGAEIIVADMLYKNTTTNSTGEGYQWSTCRRLKQKGREQELQEHRCKE